MCLGVSQYAILQTINDFGTLCGRGCTVRSQCAGFWGITPPKTVPHRKALDSNIGTKKTAGKWVSHQSELNRDDIWIVHNKMIDVQHIDIHLHHPPSGSGWDGVDGDGDGHQMWNSKRWSAAAS